MNYFISLIEKRVTGYGRSSNEEMIGYITVPIEIYEQITSCPEGHYCTYENDVVEYILIEGYVKPIDYEVLHKEITQATYENVETTSFDNLINMDMLLILDEKLNAIMKHLGVTL